MPLLATIHKSFSDVALEYGEAELRDERLSQRLVQLGALFASQPDASFPRMGSDADLEATYRFLNNPKVAAPGILAPHFRQTRRRASEAASVVVAHDTTEFNFGRSRRTDLGRVGQGKSFGFYGHFSLAVEKAERTPLGVAGVEIYRRQGGKGRRSHRKLQSDPHNEGHRWLRGVEEAEANLGHTLSPIHVMDREGDCYALMAALAERKSRFVIRMAQASRKITGREEGTVGEALAGATVLAEREVSLTERMPNPLPSYRKHHPPRHARTAKLHISAERVTLVRPASASQCPQRDLPLNVVRVFEVSPPAGEPAVEWRLWTTEPIDTAEQVLAVVDAYRCRWVIEEYFRALKSGCAIEERQLDTTHGLSNTLALFAPIAWRLLCLRTVARSNETRSAEEALTKTQLLCLRRALPRLRRIELPENPSVQDAMRGVAALGGHIKSNGEPGWIVLGRGLDKLLTLELGYLLSQDPPTRDPEM